MVQGPDGARSSRPDVQSIICSQAAFFTHATYWESGELLDAVCFIGLDMSQEAKGHGGWWGGDPFGRCIRTARSGSILQDCTQQKTGGST